MPLMNSAAFLTGTWAFAHTRAASIKNDSAVHVSRPWYEAQAFTGTRAKQGYERIAACSDFTRRLGYARCGDVYKIINASQERIAAFCHGGFGVIWLCYLLALPPDVFLPSFSPWRIPV